MQKKNAMRMLAVVVSAGMIFAGCGKSQDAAGEDRTTQETQTETKVDTTAGTTETVEVLPDSEKSEVFDEIVIGEDYLAAHNIKISPKLTEENQYDYLGLLSQEMYNRNFTVFDVGETETIVTIDLRLQHSEVYTVYFDFAVEFFDRYTGNNITKHPDIISESDIGETELSARDGYTVSVVKEETVLSEPKKGMDGAMHSSWRCKRITYKITHPANYDGLVMLMSAYDNQQLRAENEAFTSEDYKIMDKYDIYYKYDNYYSGWKFYTATDN